jgi:hypothetical protein
MKRFLLLLFLTAAFCCSKVQAQQFYSDINAWKTGTLKHADNILVIGFSLSDCISCYPDFANVMTSFYSSNLAQKNDVVLLVPDSESAETYKTFILQNFPGSDASTTVVTNTSYYDQLRKDLNTTLFYTILERNYLVTIDNGSLTDPANVAKFNSYINR